MWFCMPGSCPGFLTYIERTMAADAALVMVRPTASKYSVFIFLVFGLYTDFSPRGFIRRRISLFRKSVEMRNQRSATMVTDMMKKLTASDFIKIPRWFETAKINIILKSWMSIFIYSNNL